MALELRPACEKCGAATPADGVAFICAYECTWCAACAGASHAICPNCRGELKMRPRKGAAPPSPEGLLQGTTWRHGEDAQGRPVEEGITIRELWRGEGGRRALLVEIAAGGRWKG